MKKEDIIIEELTRIKTLINYDTLSTADENSLNEALPAAVAAIPYTSTNLGFLAGGTAAAGTAAAGTAAATFLGLGPVGWTILAVAGLGALGTWYFTKDTDTEKIKEIFDMCENDPESKNWKPSMTSYRQEEITKKLRKAMKGLGTDEEAVYRNLSEFKSPADFCVVSKKYKDWYGESLWEAIDDDFDYGWEEIAKPLVKMIESYATTEFENICKNDPEKCAEGLKEYCKKVPSDKKCEVLKKEEKKDDKEVDKEEQKKPSDGTSTIVQGEKDDPFQYKKEGDRYFYAMKNEGSNPNWVEADELEKNAIVSNVDF